MVCKQCQSPFEVAAEDLAFYDKVSPVFGGKKYLIPPPTLCPDCRRRGRLLFRNERNLYRRTCDLCKRTIISMYSPDKPLKVYCPACWWSDKWDPLEYVRDFDFSRPFFDQLLELGRDVPHLSLTSSPDAEDQNCHFINFAGNSKNCYMVFDSDFNEDCYYGKVVKHSRNCVDCAYVRQSEQCYECVECVGSYGLRYSQDCSNCSESAFLKNCVGCKNCLFSANLVQKEFYVRNRPCTKEEYKKTLAEFRLNDSASVEKHRKDFQDYVKRFPVKCVHQLKTENCSGDYIVSSKDCRDCFSVENGETLAHCDHLYTAKDCVDVSSFGEKIERVLEGGAIGIGAYNILFGFTNVFGCSDMAYCIEMRSSKNCFGCASMWRGENCVLNKKYSKPEYEALLPRIIDHMKGAGEWGSYFPSDLSFFGYNETVASDFYPLSKTQAQKLGFQWSDYEAPPQKVAKVIPGERLPGLIKDIPDDVLNWAIVCPISKKPFRVTVAELAYYRKNDLPMPRKHPDIRHRERMALRNPIRLYNRNCAKCGAAIQTTYAPDRPEMVYCEACYLKEVY